MSYTAVSSQTPLAFAQQEWNRQQYVHCRTSLQLNNLGKLWSSLSGVWLVWKCICLWFWKNMFVGNLGLVRKGSRFKWRWGEVRWNDMYWGRQRRIIRGRQERDLKTLERKNSCHYHPMYYSHLHPVNSIILHIFNFEWVSYYHLKLKFYLFLQCYNKAKF